MEEDEEGRCWRIRRGKQVEMERMEFLSVRIKFKHKCTDRNFYKLVHGEWIWNEGS